MILSSIQRRWSFGSSRSASAQVRKFDSASASAVSEADPGGAQASVRSSSSPSMGGMMRPEGVDVALVVEVGCAHEARQVADELLQADAAGPVVVQLAEHPRPNATLVLVG